uniref:Uncharacterized protein n=1 Tax=Erwinia amylovora ATCC BAA-2158 TaxID=889211 RepID=E5B8D7_ERWAM|nr:hypothetical protein predicted by Glimmer/Critica [Erwinia amylovora ATCC BAA-2158]
MSHYPGRFSITDAVLTLTETVSCVACWHSWIRGCHRMAYLNQENQSAVVLKLD